MRPGPLEDGDVVLPRDLFGDEARVLGVHWKDLEVGVGHGKPGGERRRFLFDAFFFHLLEDTGGLLRPLVLPLLTVLLDDLYHMGLCVGISVNRQKGDAYRLFIVPESGYACQFFMVYHF